MPSLSHSLAWVRSVADELGIRASNAPRRIGLLCTTFQFGTDRKVLLCANFWPRFCAPNYIWRTLGPLGRTLRSIGASADLQQHYNTAERESLDVFMPIRSEHRRPTCVVARVNRFSVFRVVRRRGKSGFAATWLHPCSRCSNGFHLDSL